MDQAALLSIDQATLFAAGNEADVRKKHAVDFFPIDKRASE
jgi:hypothetical protein